MTQVFFHISCRSSLLINIRCYLFLLLVCVTGCTAFRQPTTLRLNDSQIRQDTVWSGVVLIEGTVEVLRSATLTIVPGTEIRFVRLDADGDLLGDSSLSIKGALKAEGTRLQPIVFRSAEDNPRPGDWNEIRADFARQLTLKYCEIRDSVGGLHAHYSRGVMENCHLHQNIDGSRFGEVSFSIRHCLVERNENKGILTRQSKIHFEKNIFRQNGAGLFFMEEDRSSLIENNNFYSNQHHLRLGDFSKAQVQTQKNWFGGSDSKQLRNRIYDQYQDPRLGKIVTNPATSWRPESGLQDSLTLQQQWQLQTDGFVDASPLVVEDTLYAASWDGHLYAVDQLGRLRWKKNLGAEIDASPVAGNGLIFVQNWQREVVALDTADGTVRWRFSYPESPADDHRQGALLLIGDLVLVPSWGGTLYALDAASGNVRWQLAGHLPLRAAPVSDGERIYLSSGDGSFTALALNGQRLWTKKLPAPVLSSAALTPEGPVVVARNGQLSAFAEDGHLRWQRELGETCYYSAPIYHRGTVFLATAEGQLRKIDAQNGELIWQVSGLGAFYATPKIVGQRLYIGNNLGQLYAINLDSAEVLAQYQVDRDIQSTPAFWSEQLIFGSRDGKLHALKLIENPEPKAK